MTDGQGITLTQRELQVLTGLYAAAARLDGPPPDGRNIGLSPDDRDLLAVVRALIYLVERAGMADDPSGAPGGEDVALFTEVPPTLDMMSGTLDMVDQATGLIEEAIVWLRRVGLAMLRAGDNRRGLVLEVLSTLDHASSSLQHAAKGLASMQDETVPYSGKEAD